MKRLLVFNLDFEDELAARAPVPRPASDRARERLERRLAARFLFLGDGSDALLASWELPARFREAWLERGVELPRVTPVPLAGHALVPWGAAPSVARLAEDPGSLPDLEVVRRVNSKAFAHELATRLDLAPPGRLCHDAREVVGRLSERFAPGELWVLKRAFGFAGRGHLLGRGPELPPNGAGWLRRAFAQGDPVVLEPWLARERDFSVQLTVGRAGEVEILGVLELITGANGGFIGNRFGAIELEPDVRERLVETARAVGRELGREGYWGPVGIDAFLHDGGRLRALVEVNARHTMGRVALAFERLVPEGGVGAWVSVRAGSGLGEIGFATDPWPEEPGESSVLLIARDREELFARERAVRGARSGPESP